MGNEVLEEASIRNDFVQQGMADNNTQPQRKRGLGRRGRKTKEPVALSSFPLSSNRLHFGPNKTLRLKSDSEWGKIDLVLVVPESLEIKIYAPMHSPCYA
jgi:hypothetical protein